MKTGTAPADAHASSVTPDERAVRAGIERVLDRATGRPTRNEDDAVSIMTSTHLAIHRIAADHRLPVTAVRGHLRQAADLLRAETAAASTPPVPQRDPAGGPDRRTG